MPQKNELSGSSLNRRDLLKGFGLLSAAVALPAWSYQAPSYANDFWVRPRRLRLRHAQHRDVIDVVYWSDGEMLPGAWQEANWFLRDRVEQQAVYMNPVLLDILYAISGWLEYFSVPGGPLVLNSGYRTNRRNAMIEGAAQHSEHTSGGAADIAHPMVSAAQMAQFGRWLGGGGVGWYPQKNFTHVDRGRLRVWKG